MKKSATVICFMVLMPMIMTVNTHGQEKVTIGIFTDNQYCNCEVTGVRDYPASLAKLDSVIRFFNRAEVDAIFHLGDMIDHDMASYDSVVPRYRKSAIPVNFVLGNHDFAVPDNEKEKVLPMLGGSPGYYVKTIGKWDFIVLNGDELSMIAPQDKARKSERDSLLLDLVSSFRCNFLPWNGGISQQQVRWLNQQLQTASVNNRNVIVFCHFPVYPASCYNLYNDHQVVSLLSEYPCVKAYFNGHHHPGGYGYFNNIHFVNFKGMVDTPQSAYALVTLTSDSILIDGYGREPSRRLKIANDSTESCQTGMGRNLITLEPGEKMAEIVRKAACVTPSPRQLAWQELEFNAFIHFGMNTFTGREWGDGRDDPAQFNPTGYDPEQWVRLIRNAGMKMIILTAKHHDGFCLWPSAFTSYSVKSSPWKEGRGDVVGDVAHACRKYGLKFGIYLSPWDINEPSYGDSPAYNRFFRNQLREILSNYGEITEVWFDGACGEGANGKKQKYDWNSWYQLIRELQPEAVIAIMGPDVRWVGTESGYGRNTEWSVVPGYLLNADSIASKLQKNPLEEGFMPGDLTHEDIGSRECLKKAEYLHWYPAETDVSIRPGWFYKEQDDERVKSPEKLVDIYFNSVGKNSLLLLNVPPDKRGRINAKDSASLMGMKNILDDLFRVNLAENALIERSDSSIELVLEKGKSFDVVMLQEDIRCGQRVEKFRLECWDGMSWRAFTRGTTIGYKRLLRFPEVTTDRVRLVVEQSRGTPVIKTVGLYKYPVNDTALRQARYSIRLLTGFSLKYSGGGKTATVDNIIGSRFFDDGKWQGYEGVDFEAIIDLGTTRPVNSISAGFLQDQNSWIFMPLKVDYYISEDGETFSLAGSVINDVSENFDGSVRKEFNLNLVKKEARFVKIKAINRIVCPSWHPGKGEKCWIFTDEISVN